MSTRSHCFSTVKDEGFVKSTESFRAGEDGVQRDPSVCVIVDRNKLIDIDVYDRISLENKKQERLTSSCASVFNHFLPKFPVSKRISPRGMTPSIAFSRASTSSVLLNLRPFIAEDL